MQLFSRLMLALLLLLPLGGTIAPAHAQYDDEEYAGDDDEYAGYDDDRQAAPDDYEESLAPYGNWVDDEEYGRVWHPSVSGGWTPYVDGSWAWTPYGWTWVSYEPWSWTFHYGRWASLPIGWVWVPGFVWGPAWVDWYWGDGFVGWAPLSPFGGHVTVVNNFVFVNERDFCSRRLNRVVVDHRRVPGRVIDRWRHREADHARAPALHNIERVSHHRITRLDHKPSGTIAPRGFGAGHRVTRGDRGGEGRQRLGRPDRSGTPHGGGEARVGRPRGGAREHDEPRFGRPRDRGDREVTRERGGDRPGGRPRDPGHMSRQLDDGGADYSPPRQAPRNVRPRDDADFGTARRGNRPSSAPRWESRGSGRQRAEAPAMGTLRPAPAAIPPGATGSAPHPGAGGWHGGGGGHQVQRGGGGTVQRGGGGGTFQRGAGASPH